MASTQAEMVRQPSPSTVVDFPLSQTAGEGCVPHQGLISAAWLRVLDTVLDWLHLQQSTQWGESALFGPAGYEQSVFGPSVWKKLATFFFHKRKHLRR